MELVIYLVVGVVAAMFLIGSAAVVLVVVLTRKSAPPMIHPTVWKRYQTKLNEQLCDLGVDELDKKRDAARGFDVE